jgi:Na+/H+ antiporter NhaD/arsenite permease-like protein
VTFDVAVLLILLAAAVTSFAIERIAPELTAVLLLLALVATGLLPVGDAFAGFGSEVVVFLGSLFVVSQAMVRTGVMEGLERALTHVAERFPAAFCRSW